MSQEPTVLDLVTLRRDLRRDAVLAKAGFFLMVLPPVGCVVVAVLGASLLRQARLPLGSRWCQRMTLAAVVVLGGIVLGWILAAGDRPPVKVFGLVAATVLVGGVGFYAWAHRAAADEQRLPSQPQWWSKVLLTVWCAVPWIAALWIIRVWPLDWDAGTAEAFETAVVFGGLITGFWMTVRLSWAHQWLLEELDTATADRQPDVTA